jgi:thiamine pyrophosphokinase
MKKCILIANGDLPKKKDIKLFIKKGYTDIFCADGGFNSAIKLGIIPKCVIGDFDSIDESLHTKYKKTVEFVHISRQTDTDVEKCLKYLTAKKYTDIVLLGATGGRLDHTVANLGVILKFYKKINISIISENSFLTIISGNVEIKTIPEEQISFFAFDKKTRITSKGLKYPLKNSTLLFGEKESLSNVSTKEKINLKISYGALFVIRDIDFMVNNDLL